MMGVDICSGLHRKSHTTILSPGLPGSRPVQDGAVIQQMAVPKGHTYSDITTNHELATSSANEAFLLFP